MPTAITSKSYAFDFIEKFEGNFFPWFQHLSGGDAASGQFNFALVVLPDGAKTTVKTIRF
jgi:hypothetical protein